MENATLVFARKSVVEKLDLMLGLADQRVRSGEATKTTVALTLTVEKDDDGEVVVGFTLKDGGTVKGEWETEGAGQRTLDQAVGELCETLRSNGGTVEISSGRADQDLVLPGYRVPSGNAA